MTEQDTWWDGGSPLEQEFKYDDENDLQTLKVYSPAKLKGEIPACKADSDKIWVIYIHGGAWRDPLVDATAFKPTITKLLDSPASRSRIHAFASLNYRLSPHPNFPQDASTPRSQLRIAKHPDHIKDVCAALSYLQQHYDIKDNYLLVGHSCGATLAMQVMIGERTLKNMGVLAHEPKYKVQTPQAVLGVAGIYDLRLLRDKHSHISAYNEFLVAAFGDDESFWARVSPTKFPDWEQACVKKLIAVATSVNDELVDGTQADAFVDVSGLSGANLVDMTGRLTKTHNAIFESGELALVVEETLESWSVELTKDRNRQ